MLQFYGALSLFPRFQVVSTRVMQEFYIQLNHPTKAPDFHHSL